MMKLIPLRASCLAASLTLGACATLSPQTATDMQAALDAAQIAEGIYAASPKADPKVVAQLTHLLAAAQAAVTSLAQSKAPADQAAATAALAALAAYEAAYPAVTVR